MTSEQVVVSEAIAKTVAEATRVAIQAMAMTTAEGPQSAAGSKKGRPSMKQPTFNWEVEDKYSELKTFRLEVNNILMTYSTPQTERLAMVKDWLGRKGLQFIESLMSEEKDMCSTLEGLFKILTNKFRSYFNKTRKSLQFCKLSR